MISVFVVIVVLVICRFGLGMRILTSIVAACVTGWVFSGILLSIRGGFEDFDSEHLMERKMAYTILSTLAIILLIINLVVGAHRENRRSVRARTN